MSLCILLHIRPCQVHHAKVWQPYGRSSYDYAKQKRKDHHLRRQFNENPSITLGCPGHVIMHFIIYVQEYMRWESHIAGVLVTMLPLPFQSLRALQCQLFGKASPCQSPFCAEVCLMVLPETLASEVFTAAVSSHICWLDPSTSTCALWSVHKWQVIAYLHTSLYHYSQWQWSVLVFCLVSCRTTIACHSQPQTLSLLSLRIFTFVSSVNSSKFTGMVPIRLIAKFHI